MKNKFPVVSQSKGKARMAFVSSGGHWDSDECEMLAMTAPTLQPQWYYNGGPGFVVPSNKKKKNFVSGSLTIKRFYFTENYTKTFS